MTINRRSGLIALMSGIAVIYPQCAYADTDSSAAATDAASVSPAASNGEIIVTATKRSSTVQNTPISIAATSGAELQARGITNFSTLAQSTPGVSLKNEGPGQTEIEMRGMTSSGGNSPTVGFYLDDIPLSPPAGAQNGKVVIDPTLYDLNRVEVLRGPQGTLYGAGSMGGTVRLIPNQPDPTKFEASAESILSGTVGGGFNHADNAMVNVPLVSDTLALRVVGSEAFTSGWIARIVDNPFPIPTNNGAIRGNVLAAPVQQDFPGVNQEQQYGARASLLWKPTPELTITPSIFHQQSKQDGISAYDSNPGTDAHFEPFNIPEPLTDKITILSLNVNYDFGWADLTSSTSAWKRRSSQIEDGSEGLNNPQSGATITANNGLPNPGFYGPDGTGAVFGREDDPSRQFSQEIRLASKGNGKLTWLVGAYFSSYAATWNFNGTTLNPSAFEDIGTLAPATTTHWFDAVSPTKQQQYALFGETSYAITDKLKATVGARYYKYDYSFSSTISGWGSGLGAATPSRSGLIKLATDGVDPKFNLAYTVSPDFMTYATVSRGNRPGGGNAQYPTTGPFWSGVFGAYNFSGNRWPATYKPDSVWNFELGEKARLFDRRLTINASVYYEAWNNIQLLALPGDWALNINGNQATIYGSEIEAHAILGGGFELSASGGYTHARVQAGPHWEITPSDRLPDVAPESGNVILSYTRDLSSKYTLTAQVENSYVGSRFSLAFPFGFSENGKYIKLPGYDLTNFRIGIKSDAGWTATVFASNAFNKRAQLESLIAETLPSASFNRIVTNQPATIGIDLTWKL